MAVNTEGFVTPEQSFGGLYKAADTLERRRYREDQLAAQGQSRRNAAGTFLNSYLDQKDFLTGTNYDPEIVRRLNEAMQEGAALAQQGADTPTIMMALGPKVQQLNEYSTKAKLIDQQIKNASTKLKQYKGYNTEALADEARRMAFYDQDGKLKDISVVDPNEDWITETVKQHPEKVTTGAGFDDFVAKTPLMEESEEIQTMQSGRKRNVRYDAKRPFWMGLSKDEKGDPYLDFAGNPVGLDVMSTTIKDDKGKSIWNPETNMEYRVVDKNVFNAIMKHNPDVADYVRGQVNSHFREMGAEKIPAEGSAQWDMMARNIMYDELKTRDRSSFKTRDNETKSAPVTRIELGYPAYAPKSSGSGGSETQIRDVYGEISNKIASSGKKLPMGLGTGIEMNQLNATAQKHVLEYVNKLVGSGMTQSDIAIVQTPDGTINIVDPVEGKVIAPIDFGDINISAQPGIKEKRQVIQQINKTYNLKGKSFTHDQVEKAAKQSGMTVDEYIKAAGLK